MAKKSRERQRTGAQRIGKRTAPERREQEPVREAGVVDLRELRERLQRERDEAVARLQSLRISPEFEDDGSPGRNESAMEEGDAAQASERRDMSFTTRERLAKRINGLTAALERIERGEYGRCSMCGREIEPPRLAAIPEASTCLECQARLEHAA